MDDIIHRSLRIVLFEAAVFPVHKHKAPTTSWTPSKKEPDIDSWSNVVELGLLLPGTASENCKIYIDRMKATYASKKVEERGWIADTFMGPAVKRLDGILKYRPDLKHGEAAFVDFFKFATEVFAEHCLSKPNRDTDIDILIIASRRSDMAILRDK